MSVISHSVTAASVTMQFTAGQMPSKPLAVQSSLSAVCSLLGLTVPPDLAFDQSMFTHVPVRAGKRLYTMGQSCDYLYMVNSGFLKTVANDGQGGEVVLSFPMKGDLLGIDGIYQKTYQSECVALADSVVVAIPYKTLLLLSQKHAGLETELLQVMAKYLLHAQHTVAMIGSLSAEARVARFLVLLSDRFAALGYSSRAYALRMTRQDIGAHLGLTLETVSRTFSLFKDLGYIDVDQRQIVIHDLETLRTLRRVPASARPIKHVLSSARQTRYTASLPQAA